MAENLPYVNAYGSVVNLFEEIRKAAVPAKFTQDFMATVLGLKSSSYRAMIPLLKRLGFLDQANAPTAAYKEYRDQSKSKPVMARQIRHGYVALFAAHEFAQKLSRTELVSKLRTITGAGEDDAVVPLIAATFTELCKLADFESDVQDLHEEKRPASREKRSGQPEVSSGGAGGGHSFGISYTINLNLPATTEVEVFNAIFKSLREHILGGK